MKLLFLLLLPLSLRAAELQVPLIFTSGDKEVLRLTAAELARRPNVRTIEIADPFYKKAKKYRAVPLRDLLTAAYGGAWSENALGEVFFDALDGYRSHAKVSVLMQSGGMVAFEDLDAKDWQVIPGKSITPAPYYLVWTGPEQLPSAGYPWPWAVTGVKMAILEDEYPNALPKGAGPDTAAGRGWNLFRKNCISCHSISGDGGTLGPDLNAPRGVTRYQKRSFLRAFIKQASSFRRTKMPDFGELEKSELDDLLAYFDHMSELHGTK